MKILFVFSSDCSSTAKGFTDAAVLEFLASVDRKTNRKKKMVFTECGTVILCETKNLKKPVLKST